MEASLNSVSSSEKHKAIPAPTIRWSTRVFLPIAILLAFLALFAGSLIQSIIPISQVTVIPVVERPALLKVVSKSDTTKGSVVAQAAGWIEPSPFPVFATALTNGTIEEVLFLEGEDVSKGDVLVRLIDEDAMLDLERAEVETRAAQETWDANIKLQREAEIAAANLEEIQASLELSKAELDRENAKLHEAEMIFNRRANLIKGGSISQEEYDITEASLKSQEAEVRVVSKRIKELEAKVDRANAELKAANKNLELRTDEKRNLELCQVRLDEAKLRVKRLEIPSPIDGVVMRRLVQPGSMMMSASDNPEMARVAELYDPENLQVRVDVPLADAGKIGVGQPAEIVIEIMPNKTFTGTVTRLTNLADIQKNTLEVKVAITNPVPELKPDMLARVRFLSIQENSKTETKAKGLSVYAPANVIKDDVSWVISEYDGKTGIAAKRSVTLTGASDGEWSEIESGLNPGDLLITSSLIGIEDGQKVKIIKGGTE